MYLDLLGAVAVAGCARGCGRGRVWYKEEGELDRLQTLVHRLPAPVRPTNPLPLRHPLPLRLHRPRRQATNRATSTP